MKLKLAARMGQEPGVQPGGSRRNTGVGQGPSRPSQGLCVTRGPSLDATVTKSPSNPGRALLLERVHPFTVLLSHPSHQKTRGSIRCPSPHSSSFGPPPPAPNFPGLGWEGIQSSLCGMTSPTGLSAEWFLIWIPAPSSCLPRQPWAGNTLKGRCQPE